jgi:hypothetical protein
MMVGIVRIDLTDYAEAGFPHRSVYLRGCVHVCWDVRIDLTDYAEASFPHRSVYLRGCVHACV